MAMGGVLSQEGGVVMTKSFLLRLHSFGTKGGELPEQVLSQPRDSGLCGPCGAVSQPVWGHDPSRIVADEMIGLWIAMIAVPFSWLNLALAFGLFRLFDIWKPMGIRRMEKFPGGWGVMLDDVLAGLYSLAVMHIYLFFQN